ncbi:MAG TPA: glycosyltransferase family 1 protein [Stenomitos sp.]
MQITYDFQIFAWQRYGGISRYFYELITRMPTLSEVPVSLFMGLHVNEYSFDAHRDQFTRFFGVKHHLPKRMSRLASLANLALFQGFLKSTPRTIYHPTFYRPLQDGFKGKRILTVYDMIHEIFPEYFPGEITAEWKRRSIPQADGIICLSESAKQDLQRYFDVPSEKIQIIHLANSLEIPVTSPSLVGRPYVLYVGTRAGYKNFPMLARAFAQVRSLRKEFTLVCFGGGAFTPDEQDLFRSLGIEASVANYQGPDGMLANLYRYASAFVYPSLYEGFGFPPLEAMAYGCPVLVSRASSIPEVVGEAGLYFDPREADDLSHQLERLLADDSLRQTLAKRGTERERRFSWDRCAQETLAFYQRIAAS